MPASEGPSAFVAPGAKIEFWAFTIATFLAFLTASILPFLSAILASTGMSTNDIGIVLSAPVVPVTATLLLSGEIINRYGSYLTALIGLLLFLFSMVAFQAVIASMIGSTIVRCIMGAGYGLFFPAAMVHARSLLRGPRTSYLFGIFSSMIVLPQMLGPGLAELYFHQIGYAFLFPVFSVPILIGIAIFAALCRRTPNPAGNIAVPERYFALLSRPATLLPNMTILVVGLIWGFSLSFMALLLARRGVSNAYFFTACTVSLLVCRFTILSWVSLWPKPISVACGLLLMGIAYLLGGHALGQRQLVVVTGIVFGAGYSTAFPILGTWISDQFPPGERGKPMALYSAVFHTGIYIVPALAALSTPWLPLERSLDLLGALGVVAAMLLLFASQLRPSLVKLDQREGN
jgi:MFS family permease